jgi:hypothetical protein
LHPIFENARNINTRISPINHANKIETAITQRVVHQLTDPSALLNAGFAHITINEKAIQVIKIEIIKNTIQ